MKRIALLLLLLLAACSRAERIPLTPTATATPTPAPTETPIPTPTKVDVRVNIPAEVEQAIGNEDYQKLVESIGENGDIRAMDYESGRETDFVINPETIQVSQTADFHFKQVVTAQTEAKSKKEEVKVVWNPHTGKWVKVTEVHLITGHWRI